MLNRYLISFSLLLLLILLAACSAGSGETRPTQTAQAERAIRQATQIVRSRQATQAAAERSLIATAQAARELAAFQWPLVMLDEFDDNANEWSTGEDQDPDLASVVWELSDGVYRWNASAVEGFIWWVTPTQEDLEDFYVSVDVRQVSGPESGEFGLVFRRNEDLGYYLFEISAQEQFSVSRYDYASESWYTLVDWRPSPVLRSGFFNTLAVVGQADRFYFFANDERLVEIQDTLDIDAIPIGAAGLVVGLSDPGDQAVWEFDRFELRAPSSPETDQTPTPTP